ncbi:phosphotransferase [Yinghuangia sp. YIM S09857]|uniref:phosphotransferase n=1 Tax=Yinghuangia sp. YIM S09857 TaxID=3436929 RepID=UPI003F52DD32
MRVDYWSLPADVHAALALRLGAAPASAATQPGGFSGGVAARLTLPDGRAVFVKGCPERHPIIAQYEVEAWFGRKVREWWGGRGDSGGGVSGGGDGRGSGGGRGSDGGRGAARAFPAPELWGELDAAGWYLLVFEDVAGHDADLSDPADLSACLALFDRLTAAPYPGAARTRVPPVAVSLGHLAAGWRRIAEEPPAYLDPWARAHLGELVARETEWVAAAEGDLPVHTDLHPGNVLVTDAFEAVAVDWTRPSAGAAWVDPLLFCLRDPAVRDLPPWFDERYALPAPVLRAFLAGAAGHWTDAARLPAPGYAPGLRAYEAARAAKALAWLRRAHDDDRS